MTDMDPGDLTSRFDGKDLLHVPTVHLNGTAKESLLEALVNAMEKVREAEDAVRQTHPHGRDYYVQEGDPTQKAISQYVRRMAALANVYDELTAIAIAVQAQEK